MEKDVLILAVESSCDETAAAVVKNGREVLSNIISSQIALHTVYGGVVPEIASRKHIEKINQVIKEALEEARKTLQDMDAIAVTYGPGLVGALLVGVSAAKAISFASGIPLIGVHHIEGHINANYIENKELEPPYICLVVSGGHSHLVLVKEYGEYEILGRTRDDAAGEAFDKVARAIGLGYPGGPKIDKVAKEGKLKAVVSITLDEEFVVHDIKVIEGEKGLFIAMPSKKAVDGEYRDIAHPINSGTRERIQSIILEEYQKELLETEVI